MEEELFNLHQKRTIHNSPPVNSKNFETVVPESEEVFIEWLELEKNKLEWQKQSEKKNPLIQDQQFSGTLLKSLLSNRIQVTYATWWSSNLRMDSTISMSFLGLTQA
ncbi:hypothetical protein K3495_g16205, partial [Podosphaera aphanis]